MVDTFFRTIGCLIAACLATSVWAVSILPGVDFIRSIQRKAEAVYHNGRIVIEEDTDVGSGAVSTAIETHPIFALRAPGEDYTAGGYASSVIGTTGISVVQSAAQVTGPRWRTNSLSSCWICSCKCMAGPSLIKSTRHFCLQC